MKKLSALRGAVFCKNTESDIREQTRTLWARLLADNSLSETDVVSLVFSVTPDINAKNPCAALRQEGYARELALFCTQEPVFADMPGGVIRALVYCYLDAGAAPVHCYCNGAQALRPDRAGT